MGYAPVMPVVPTMTEVDLGSELEQRVGGIWWLLTREAPSDLSRTAASVLARLRHDGPQRVTTLATHEHISQPSMSDVVRRLCDRGLVERHDDPADKRACRISITPAGEQVLRERAEARSRWLTSRLAHLAAEDRATLLAALKLLDTLLADGDTA
jgi:DNA-binding MarR family transcriptional regulator